MLVKGSTRQSQRNFTSDLSQGDESLIAACLDGDEQAWEALITRYNRLIYSIPFRYGLSDSESADIFQTVCLKLLENLQSLRDSGKLSSWLITVTSRECWSTARRRARFTQTDDGITGDELDLMDLAPLPEEAAVVMEEQQAVRTAFQHLPSKCQRLLWHLFYDRSGPSYAEIGNRLGVPGGSIGPWRARCLTRLKNLLEEWA